jgi:hypothetical protein
MIKRTANLALQGGVKLRNLWEWGSRPVNSLGMGSEGPTPQYRLGRETRSAHKGA